MVEEDGEIKRVASRAKAGGICPMCEHRAHVEAANGQRALEELKAKHARFANWLIEHGREAA